MELGLPHHWPHSLVPGSGSLVHLLDVGVVSNERRAGQRGRVEALVADADAVEADRDDLRADALCGIETIAVEVVRIEIIAVREPAPRAASIAERRQTAARVCFKWDRGSSIRC